MAKEVTLTDKVGKSIKVELRGVTDDAVEVLLLPQRKKYLIPLDKLEEESVDIVKKWKKAGGHLSKDFKLQFEANKSTKTVNSPSYYYYDTEDRNLVMAPKVTITNASFNNKSTPVVMRVMILGQSTATKTMMIFSNEDFNIPSLEPRSAHKVEVKQIQSTFDNEGYKHGNKYYGYAIFLMKGKEVLHSEFSPKSVEDRYAHKLVKVEKGATEL